MHVLEEHEQGRWSGKVSNQLDQHADGLGLLTLGTHLELGVAIDG